MRKLLEAEAAGNERAKLAVDVFCYRLRKYIAAYVGVLGGLDALVFTGGIGENAPAVRARVGRGARRDGDRDRPGAQRRRRAGGEAEISPAGSALPRAGDPDQRGAADRPRHLPDRARAAARHEAGPHPARPAPPARRSSSSVSGGGRLEPAPARRRAPGATEPRAAPSPGQGTTVADVLAPALPRGEAEGRGEGAGDGRQGGRRHAPAGRRGDASRSSPRGAERAPRSRRTSASTRRRRSAPRSRATCGVRTDDGFELESDTLKYWGDEERVFTRDAVRFRAGHDVGQRAGAWSTARGRGSPCCADVRLRLEDAAGPADGRRGGERPGLAGGAAGRRSTGASLVRAGRARAALAGASS